MSMTDLHMLARGIGCSLYNKGLNEGKSVASFCCQVEALVPDV